MQRFISQRKLWLIALIIQITTFHASAQTPSSVASAEPGATTRAAGVGEPAQIYIAPENSSANPVTENFFLVSWDVASGPVSTYRLLERQWQEGAGAFTPYAEIYRGSVRRFPVEFRTTGTYIYAAQACDASGECGPLTGKNARTVYVRYTTRPGIAGAVTSSPASPVSTATYSINWGASSTGTVAYYRLLERRVAPDTTAYREIYRGLSRSHSISDNTDGTYQYLVFACGQLDECAEPRFAQVVFAGKTLGEPNRIYITPESSSTNPITQNFFLLSWDVASGPVSTYRLLERRWQEGAGTFTPYAEIYRGSTRRFPVEFRTTGTYIYAVHSCDASGQCGPLTGKNAKTVYVATTNRPGIAGAVTTTPPSPVSTSGYAVQWGAPTTGDVVYYRLLERRVAPDTTAYRELYRGGARSYSITDNPAGTYQYQVIACGRLDECAEPRFAQIVSTAGLVSGPEKPGPLTTNPASPITSDSFMLRWTPTTDDAVAYYRLMEQQIAPETTAYREIYRGPSLVHLVAGNTAGDYRYQLLACDLADACSQPREAQVTLHTAPQPPAAVTVPAFTASGDFDVEWTAAVGPLQSYEIGRFDATGNLLANIGTGSSTSTTFALRGQPLGVARFGVRSCYTAVSPALCSPFTLTAPISIGDTLPPAERFSAAPQRNDGDFTLSWSVVPGADSYRLLEGRENDEPSKIFSGDATSTSLGDRTSGAYSYLLRACRGQVCGNPRSLDGGAVVVTNEQLADRPGVENPPTPHVEPMPAEDLESTTLGATEGQFQITHRGAATLSLPMLKLPGSGDVAPQLSLDYNSEAGNGPLGLGWSIGGLSTITRCRQTFEQDGVDRAVMLDQDDRFCLDGARLILTAGESYGAHLSEYRTEIESFARIVAYRDGATQGPTSFRVYGKDGSVSEYGRTADSRYTADSARKTVITWAQNRFQNSVRNYITYEYLETDRGEHLIENVRYTGNEAAGLTPYNRVGFVYETRSSSDFQLGYRNGREVLQTRRLAYVGVYSTPPGAGEQVVRTYFPAYELSNSSQQIVTAWRECSDPDTCLTPATFEYQEGNNDFAATPVTSNIPVSLNGLQFGDVTGDGRQDIVWLEFSDNGKLYFQVAPSDGRTYDFSAQPHIIESDIEDQVTLANWQLIDFDLDSRTDLMVPVEGIGWLVHRSDGQHFDPVPVVTGVPIGPALAGALIVDVDGDTLPDLVQLIDNVFGSEPSATFFYPLERDPAGDLPYRFGSPRRMPLLAARATYPDTFSTQVAYNLKSRRMVDFDGDGVLDYLATAQEFKRCSFGPEPELPIDPCGGQFDPPYPPEARVFMKSGLGPHQETYTVPGRGSAAGIRTPDVNGDGLSDLLFTQSNTWFYRLNRGDRTFSDQRTVGPLSGDGTQDSKHLQLLDVNRDGVTDLLYPKDGRYFARVWNGQSYDPARATSAFYNAGQLAQEQHLFLDVNGDALPDFLRVVLESRFYQVRLFQDAFQSRGRLTRLINGLGAETRIGYQPLTADGVYVRENSAASLVWGRGSVVRDLLTPNYVVTALETSAPTPANPDGRAREEYRYRGAKVQGGGRGFLGFRVFEALDTQTRVVTITKYRQDFPFIGSPYAIELRLDDGSLLSVTSTLYGQRETARSSTAASRVS